MKKNTLYLFILLLITGLNTSCNYLDIVPDETATEHGSVMYGLYR